MTAIKITPSEIQDKAYSIASEYQGNLTIRQLYYQFVARGLIDNGQKSYRRIVDALSMARLSGAFPFNWIEDRTRTCHATDASTDATDVDEGLDRIAYDLQTADRWAIARARWFNQPEYVMVGVEKEALAGVFQNPCTSLGVGLFVFRGYSSLSALWRLVQNVRQATSTNDVERVVLLYFGDHDPDGWEIPRSAMRNIKQIAAVEGIELPELVLERAALNMDQIEQYEPPPFAAKVTSSRYQAYVDEHETDEAWELDALRPDVLQSLIREGVNAHFSQEVYGENMRIVRQKRQEIRDRMREPEWIGSVLTD